MNVNEFFAGDTFVTSALPLDRAILCGIMCIEKESLPDGKIKVTFKRMNGDEEFSFFSDLSGNVQIGNWIKHEILPIDNA